MSDWTDEIKLSREKTTNGALTVAPTQAYLKIDAPVKWFTEDKDVSSFALAFYDAIFKDQRNCNIGPTITCNNPQIGVTVTPVKAGLFHYSVAVTFLRGGRTETLIIAGCPTAHVDP